MNLYKSILGIGAIVAAGATVENMLETIIDSQVFQLSTTKYAPNGIQEYLWSDCIERDEVTIGNFYEYVDQQDYCGKITQKRP